MLSLWSMIQGCGGRGGCKSSISGSPRMWQRAADRSERALDKCTTNHHLVRHERRPRTRGMSVARTTRQAPSPRTTQNCENADRDDPKRRARREQSFPSGHTLETAAVALTAGHVLWREGMADARIAFPIATMIPMLEGVGRLYLDRHWTTDVIAGLLAGITVASICVSGYEQRAQR